MTEVTSFQQSILPQLIEQAKTFPPTQYKSSFDITTSNGRKYYLTLFDDTAQENSQREFAFCSPQEALTLWPNLSARTDIREIPYSVSIGAHEQATYESSGLIMQLKHYGFDELADQVTVVDMGMQKVLMVIPDLGMSLGELEEKEFLEDGYSMKNDVSLEAISNLWNCIANLELDSSDLNPSNIILHGGTLILIDRTISPEWIYTTQSYPYKFQQVKPFMLSKFFDTFGFIGFSDSDLKRVLQDSVC